MTEFSILDYSDPFLSESVPNLLQDKSTKRGLIFASHSLKEKGFGFDEIITPELVLAPDSPIVPRIRKTASERDHRTKKNAEVFTPSWLCNRMNSLIDSSWFGRDGVFNAESDDGRDWEPTEGKIEFPEGRTWLDYIRSNRLEITCGEAPYLASRYDPVTGDPIPVPRRIGILDRKLRVVSENTHDEAEWLRYAEESLKHTYGFEYQGDSLFIARCNVLLDCAEHFICRFGKSVEPATGRHLANIVAWNLWQMDGLTGNIPCDGDSGKGIDSGIPAIIWDWDAGVRVPYLSLLKNSGDAQAEK